MSCWGRGKPYHTYADKKGKIVCPNKEKPGVGQKATEKRKYYQVGYNMHNRERSRKRKIANLLLG